MLDGQPASADEDDEVKYVLVTKQLAFDTRSEEQQTRQIYTTRVQDTTAPCSIQIKHAERKLEYWQSNRRAAPTPAAGLDLDRDL